MIAVHTDSGLGNQMLDYAEYIALRQSNPKQTMYLEKMIYELPREEGMFSMWNGYELDRVFGIEVQDIKSLFSEEQWEDVLEIVKNSRFWEHGWAYHAPMVQAFAKYDVTLHPDQKIVNLSGDGNEIKTVQREQNGAGESAHRKVFSPRKCLTLFFQTRLGYHIKRYLRKILAGELIRRSTKSVSLFRTYEGDVLTGHSLAFNYKGFEQEKIDAQVRRAFTFPEITDERNLEMLRILQSTQSVSIHARRGDMLFRNGYCYRYGFFKRSVRYIKRKVKDPVFVFFTDEKSVEWCKENEKIFGLDFTKDTVYFVNWNTGNDSFRDMQLMSQCKHNIFTESSFGFWGAYLNDNPDKITCAPDPLIYATNSF